MVRTYNTVDTLKRTKDKYTSPLPIGLLPPPLLGGDKCTRSGGGGVETTCPLFRGCPLLQRVHHMYIPYSAESPGDRPLPSGNQSLLGCTHSAGN